jgi:hypothetical protein
MGAAGESKIISQPLYEALSKTAQTEGISVEELLEKVVENFLAERRAKKAG